MSEKDPFIFIEHMLESIRDIESFTKGISKENLSNNKEKLNAVVRSIEIIGEAAKSIPPLFKNKHPEVSWKEIIGTRDVLIHHYFGIDVNILWAIITKDLRVLKKQLIKIKDGLEK